MAFQARLTQGVVAPVGDLALLLQTISDSQNNVVKDACAPHRGVKIINAAVIAAAIANPFDGQSGLGVC